MIAATGHLDPITSPDMAPISGNCTQIKRDTSSSSLASQQHRWIIVGVVLGLLVFGLLLWCCCARGTYRRTYRETDSPERPFSNPERFTSIPTQRPSSIVSLTKPRKAKKRRPRVIPEERSHPTAPHARTERVAHEPQDDGLPNDPPFAGWSEEAIKRAEIPQQMQQQYMEPLAARLTSLRPQRASIRHSESRIHRPARRPRRPRNSLRPENITDRGIPNLASPPPPLVRREEITLEGSFRGVFEHPSGARMEGLFDRTFRGMFDEDNPPRPL